MIEEIKRRILDGGSITIDEAVQLAENCDIDELCDAADEIRRQFCGDRMDTCSIVNARSGLCGEDCKWCSQSVKAKSDVKKYEIIDTETLLNLAKRNDGYGVDRFSMVTSGRKVSARDAERFCDDYKKIASETDMKLCASMGLVDKPTLEMLKTAGVTRYHCNMETVSAYFPSLCSTHTPADKRQTIRDAKSVGLEVCSGGIIGMGETMRQRVEFAFELKELGVDSVPLNVLNPIKGTALENTPLLGEEEIIRTAAIFRLILPKVVIRFAGGRARLSREAVKRMMRGGVNGTMIGDLLTTTGNNVADDFRLFEECGFTTKKQ